MVIAARTRCIAALVITALAAPGWARAQTSRPVITVTTAPLAGAIRAGETISVRVTVRLPKDVHVQSDKPRDPSVIPTALTFAAPDGIAVERIAYPKAVELAQSGRAEALTVFGGEFTIDARLTVPTGVPSGKQLLRGTLRYQACTETVCFPPARAALEWVLTVIGVDSGQDLKRNPPSHGFRSTPLV